MSSSPDNFESLEKLLRLKRHEQPPPRYFNEFSGRVLARIERGDGRPSWWERFGFDLRPALAAGAGTFACALIIYGVATSEGQVEAIGTPGSFGFAADSSAAPAIGSPSQSLLANAEQSVGANSTNPVSSYGSQFNRSGFNAQIVPTGFHVPTRP